MKRCLTSALALILLFALSLPLAVGATSLSPNQIKYGDVGGDGEIDLTDVIVLCQYLADFDWDTGESSVEVSGGADADGSGEIDLSDVILLCQYLADFDWDTGESSVELGPQKPAVHVHDWFEVESTPVTCTQDGVVRYNCTGCRSVRTVTTHSLGHRMGDWRVTLLPTNEQEGVKERSCVRCDYVETGVVEKLSDEIPEDYMKVLEDVNRERAEFGLPALVYYDEGQDAADLRALECNTLFAHARPDGRSCFTVFDDLHVPDFMCAENLAFYYSADEVVEAWMNSPGHRANILSPDATAMVVSRRGDYWAQLFVILL